MMRKLRKFVTLGDYYTSTTVEGVVTPHDFSPFLSAVLVGGRNHPPPPSFFFVGGGGIPNFFIQACQKTGGSPLLVSMGGRRFLSSRGLSVLSPFIRVRGGDTLLGGEQ
jgi:hypothetical protein